MFSKCVLMSFERLKIFKISKQFMMGLKKYIIILSLCSFATIPVSIFSPRIFRFLIDNVIGEQKQELFIYVVVGLLSIYCLRYFIDCGKLYSSNIFLNKFTLLARKSVLNKYLKTSYKNILKFNESDLKMRLFDDIDNLGNFLKEQVIDYLCGLIMIVALLFLCFFINKTMLFICISLIPIVLLIDITIAKGTSKINEKIRIENEQYYSFEYNSIQFWKEIKSQCLEKAMISKFKDYRKNLAKLGLVFIRYWLYRELFNDFKANYLNKVLIYIIGAFFVINNQLSVGNLILFGEYFSLLFNEISNTYNKNVLLKTNMPFYKRFKETLLLPEENMGCVECKDLFPIEFKNVEFSYSENSKAVLKNINFKINKFDYILLTGKSGIGKTTLLKLMLGIISPDNGEITVGGVPIEKINKESMLKKIGIVMQDSFFFNMTVKENLLMVNSSASDKEILDICKKVNILDFINRLPNGINTKIGENGINISGGQRQRLALAQALIKKPEILVLDEPTSSIDNFSEKKIYKEIENSNIYSAFVISHSIESNSFFNKEYFLDNGIIKEKNNVR